MHLEMAEMDERLFDAFGGLSSKRYIFLCNMRTGISRWSKTVFADFDMPSGLMADAETKWGSLVHPDDYGMYMEDILSIFDGKKSHHHLEYRVKNRLGDYVICTCDGRVIKGDEKKDDLFVGVIINHGVMENVDPATSLFNIYEFWNHIRRLKNEKKKEMVLLIGINNFSEINDSFGYDFGNAVLKFFGEELLELVSAKGLLFRNEGVRFVFSIPDFSQADVKNLYHEIRKIAKSEIEIDGVQIALSVSGGAVTYSAAYDEFSIQTSLRYALAKSKHEQYGELVFFDETTMEQSQRTVEMTNAIRKSVLNDFRGFHMDYQPVVNSKTEKVIGAEALLRWRSDEYGEVPPGQFIPWLENDSCFYELGIWILRTSMIEAKAFLKKTPDFVLNVNLAYPQLIHEGFVEDLKEVLRETGFSGKNLCLELTERCRQVEHRLLYTVIMKMKEMGIQIALDDFGTGFSSLNLLSDLPIDILKIDRGFVSDIRYNYANQCIVKAVTNCAKDMNVHVCMEGLESRELIDFVKAYPIYSYQGYYYSKPVSGTCFMERFCG